jgi:hypothetical protein
VYFPLKNHQFSTQRFVWLETPNPPSSNIYIYIYIYLLFPRNCTKSEGNEKPPYRTKIKGGCEPIHQKCVTDIQVLGLTRGGVGGVCDGNKLKRGVEMELFYEFINPLS